MKTKLKLIIIMSVLFPSHFLFAATNSVKIKLETSECVYLDGRKDCNKNNFPEEELSFNLTKSKGGKYFASNQIETYIENEAYEPNFYLSADHLNDKELQLRVELSSRANSGKKITKVKSFLVKKLSDLSNVTVYGEPVVGSTGGYKTEVKYGIKFIK